MNNKTLCKTAADLSRRSNLPFLALLSTGAILASSLVLLLVEALVSYLITDATGLSMMNKRTALLTFQSVLVVLVTVAQPFWSCGFCKAAMDTARGIPAQPGALFQGFRRFGPLLRLFLLEVMIGLGYVALCGWLATMLYMFTPWAASLVTEMNALLADMTTVTTQAAADALMQKLMNVLLPVNLLSMLLMAVILVPWLYKVRLAIYHVLDGKHGALMSMALSTQQMRGNRLSMFLLDLRWWWYYGLLFLAAAPLVAYSYLGIDSQVLFWLLALVSYGLQLLVQWQLMPRVQTSYALAFDTLATEGNP